MFLLQSAPTILRINEILVMVSHGGSGFTLRPSAQSLHLEQSKCQVSIDERHDQVYEGLCLNESSIGI